ncbi:MAG: PIN domain-containing protein [Gammaproteobacteria bacterium]|nr:PIN domain-containing protein [Gammaproteobacteria bacterium]
MNVAYVDTSALIAVAFNEGGGAAIVNRLAEPSYLLSSNLLEAELRSACSREGTGFSPNLFSNLKWVLPDRSLTPEITAVLEAGYLRGADLWHVASALYVAQDPGEMWFVTADERQRTVAEAVGFKV